jgi:predicted dehydrogenase
MKLTRRDFSRLGSMAALASALPRAKAESDNPPGRRFGWCIVGLGRISMGHFMPGVDESKTGKLTALVSGHYEKALRQSAMYNIPAPAIYDYTEFDEIAQNPAIDGVYIALPNSMHAEYTIRAAKAGKHVLCEKPMATSVEECRKMIEACQKHNVKLMIAYRCQYNTLHLKAMQLIRSGQIGQVQAIESAFGFDIQPFFVLDGVRSPEWRLDKKMAGGGPLMDVGIYCLNASRYLTGEEPAEIRGYSSVIDQDGRFKEVEENDAWTVRFPSGILASGNTTYGGNGMNFFRAQGSKGTIEMNPAFSYDGMHLRARLANGQVVDDPEMRHDPIDFTKQADYFAHCVWNNQEPKTDGEEGLRDISLMSQIYASAGLKPL